MQLFSDRYIYYVCARELPADLLLYEVNPDYGRLLFLINKTLVFSPFYVRWLINGPLYSMFLFS